MWNLTSDSIVRLTPLSPATPSHDNCEVRMLVTRVHAGIQEFRTVHWIAACAGKTVLQ
jgi:hypothetical protein